MPDRRIQPEQLRPPLHDLQNAVHRHQRWGVIQDGLFVQRDELAGGMGVMIPFHDLPRLVEEPVHPLNLERAKFVAGFLDDGE